MLCTVYPPPEVPVEVLEPEVQEELESEELAELAQGPEDPEAQELVVQVELESASVLVLEVPVVEVLGVPVDLCSTE